MGNEANFCPPGSGGNPAGRNIDTIVQLERAALQQRTHADRLSDCIVRTASSGGSLMLHRTDPEKLPTELQERLSPS